MRCSRALCSDCITKLDGINHCQACLDELSRELTREPRPQRRAVPEPLALGAGFLVLALLAWTMLEVVLPGTGSP